MRSRHKKEDLINKMRISEIELEKLDLSKEAISDVTHFYFTHSFDH